MQTSWDLTTSLPGILIALNFLYLAGLYSGCGEAAYLGVFDCLMVNGSRAFVKLCHLDDFLHNDSLHFRLTVEVMVELKV